MAKIIRLLTCLMIVLTAVADEPEQTPVAADFVTPTVAVPYVDTPPTMDGVVDDEEWRGAVSLNALRERHGYLSSRPTRYWLSWDKENIYIAMRSWLREGERPIQSFRGEGGDPFVVMDDSYEFYFDAGGKLAGGLAAYIQYIGNFAGEKYDAAYLPEVGTRRLSFEAGWTPRNRIVETPNGRAWEMEVAVPHASILSPTPFHDGQVIRGLLARNFKRPWEQNSIEAANVFSNTSTYTKLVLKQGAPALHLLGVADMGAPTLGLKLGAYRDEAATITWHFQSDSGVDKSGSFEIGADAFTLGVDQLALDQPGEGNYRIKVTSGDILLLDWAARRGINQAKVATATFEDDRGDQVSLSLVLNPAKDYLRVSGDFINFDARDQITSTTVTINTADGKELANRTLALDAHAFVREVIPLPDLAPGTYVARLVCKAADDTIMVERETKFEKKDHAKEFPWWKTDKGNIDKVIAPWTPVKLVGDTFTVWDRSMTIGAGGLPSMIVANGETLLAAPIRLEVDGKETPAKAAIEPLSTADHKTTVHATSTLGSLRVSSDVTVEFDGMYRVEMTITPDGEVPVNSLRMVVPLAPAHAQYLSSCGEGIRWGYDHQPLPNDQGELWNSYRIDGQRMTVGSFVPYIWIGDSRRGLSWFADTDAGWVPSDDTPAITVHRDGDQSVNLIFNLISSPFTIEAPRTITFAFQATPVKSLDPQWRQRIYDFRDSFQDWQSAKTINSTRMLSPVPWSYDPEATRKQVEQWRRGPRMLSLYSQPAIPYGRHNETIHNRIPEARYFAEHWNSRGSWHIFYDDSLIDFWIYKLDEWITKCDIDGYYSDNVYPAVCHNVEAGRGYYLPDGRVQPGYNMFGIRRYFLRMRAVFAEHGKEGWIVTHMTHNPVAPWLGPVDIALDGEDNPVTAQQNRTYLDAWPLDRLRGLLPDAMGVAVTYKTEFTNPSHWKDGFRYSFSNLWRSYVAAMQLHDLLPMSGYQMPERWFHARQRFGFNEPGTRFIGYWEKHPAIQWDNPDVQISAWVRDGAVMLMPVAFTRNRSAVETTVTLDAKALGLPQVGNWRVTDAQSIASYSYIDVEGKPVNVYPNREQLIDLHADGRITLKAAHHDYRMIVITQNIR